MASTLKLKKQAQNGMNERHPHLCIPPLPPTVDLTLAGCAAALGPITSQSRPTAPAHSACGLGWLLPPRVNMLLSRSCWGGGGVQLSHSRATWTGWALLPGHTSAGSTCILQLLSSGFNLVLPCALLGTALPPVLWLLHPFQSPAQTGCLQSADPLPSSPGEPD